MIPFIENVQEKQIYSVRNEISGCLGLTGRTENHCERVLKPSYYKGCPTTKDFLKKSLNFTLKISK